MEGFRIDLKTFLGLAMPSLYTVLLYDNALNNISAPLSFLISCNKWYPTGIVVTLSLSTSESVKMESIMPHLEELIIVGRGYY